MDRIADYEFWFDKYNGVMGAFRRKMMYRMRNVIREGLYEEFPLDAKLGCIYSSERPVKIEYVVLHSECIPEVIKEFKDNVLAKETSEFELVMVVNSWKIFMGTCVLFPDLES